MISQAYSTAEQFPQVGDRTNVGVFGTGGIGAGALEKYQLGAAGSAGGVYGVFEFVDACHVRGDDPGAYRWKQPFQ